MGRGVGSRFRCSLRISGWIHETTLPGQQIHRNVETSSSRRTTSLFDESKPNLDRGANILRIGRNELIPRTRHSNQIVNDVAYLFSFVLERKRINSSIDPRFGK